MKNSISPKISKKVSFYVEKEVVIIPLVITTGDILHIKLVHIIEKVITYGARMSEDAIFIKWYDSYDMEVEILISYPWHHMITKYNQLKHSTQMRTNAEI